jgi:NAD(P)-dependent dehydrogenase (short-subunit alcohol dehydrogenase family)
MKIELSNRRAIVTASASGIGLSIARGLAAAGAHVIINGRRSETTRDAVERLLGEMPQASIAGVAGDLSTAKGVADFIDQAGEADILINNLGIYDSKDFVDITDEEWLRFFETNLFSGVRLARHYLPQMIEKNWGRLLFITSESGVTPPASRLHYATTKAAQMALARGLAETTRGTGVTSNSIVVGITRTEPVDAAIAQIAREQGISETEADRNLAAEHRPSQLLERLATAEEVANMVVYAASPQASATTGAALRVEGGGIPTIV